LETSLDISGETGCARPNGNQLRQPKPSNLFMKTLTQRSFLIALALGIFALAITSTEAAPKKVLTEDELIAELDGPNPEKVAAAMLQLERQFPTSTKAFPVMKKLLTDTRPQVRRKAARVLGVLHAEVNSTDIKAIVALLKATEPREVMDGLIALRGLKAAEALPEIVPLLQHTHLLVIGDACRTVPVLGTKDNLKDLEPLLAHADKKVQKEAQDAVRALKEKP
jgi:HEAT repeat protein